MGPGRKGLLPLLAVLVTVISWGSAFPSIRVALTAMDPLPLAAARFAMARLLALLFLLLTRPLLPRGLDAVRFAACGGIGIALYNLLLNTGQQTVAAGAASFIVNVAPVLTVILATLFLKEKFRRWAWIGMGISMAGVGLIASGQPGGLRFGSGATLLIGAAVATATYFVVQRPLVGRYGALPSTALTLLTGALWLTPWLGQGVQQALAAPWPVQAALVFLALFPAAIGYAAWTYALGHFGAARGANFLYMVPVVASTVAVPLTGELPLWTTLAGGALALGGVALVNTKGRG
ncbi:EamA family transporter [Niveispirillum lacus]|uniref:EamA family transporter n=2 Tax=Niveispirillum lacus TaxID=1981099 RepID=A0A255YZN5_9PROT|nr:EamA family transporter [Niveispirillum lacus]